MSFNRKQGYNPTENEELEDYLFKKSSEGQLEEVDLDRAYQIAQAASYLTSQKAPETVVEKIYERGGDIHALLPEEATLKSLPPAGKKGGDFADWKILRGGHGKKR